ncbi:MAG TPA: dihydrodipicolinate synthase family protein [Candidatus Sulfomarinibacteraceae bacterium]|nr:dihydrodipicolinate synthase family protein [Candidatus Sulfomarinibacteraceae bacterium]
MMTSTANDKRAELIGAMANGVVPAMATPLQDDGYRVNVNALKSLVDLLLGAGVNGLFVGGTTGEGIVLDLEQRQLLHEETLAVVDRRAPVLVHTGANNTRDTIVLGRHAAEIGADGVVVITPTFYPMPDDALLAYFVEVARAVPDLPLFVYDIPHMAVNGVGPALLEQLSQQIPNLAGLKCSRPDAQMIRQLIDALPADSGLGVFAGNERIALGSLALGASGLISGLATAVPEPFVWLTRAYAAGDWSAARREQKRINRLLDLMPAGARIGGIKAILQQRGIEVGSAVPPRHTPRCPGLWQEMQSLL